MVDSDYINIDEIPFLPSQEIVDGISYLMGDGRDEYPSRYIPMVANVIGSVTDEEVLQQIAEAMNRAGWFRLLGRFPLLDNYDAVSATKILSNYYRLFLGYEFYTRENARLNDQMDERQFTELGLKRELPDLRVKLYGRIIRHNLLESLREVQRKTILTEIVHANTKPSPERETLLSKYVQDLSDLNYNQDITFYQAHIDRLKRELDQVGKVSFDYSVTKHEEVFKNDGFVLFEYILSKYVRTERGRQADIAYFYWRLSGDKNKFIHQRPEVFKDWFGRTYPDEPLLGKFRTLQQLHSKQRSNSYSDALDWFKSTKR